MHKPKALNRGRGSIKPHYTYPVGEPVVTFASRLLRDKGVVEFVEAARILKKKGLRAGFWLVGDADPDNPATIS